MEDSIDYEDVLARIKNIYSSSTPETQKVLLQILQEICDTGESKTYEDIWLTDYKEIPVDKHTFLTNDYYLGGTNNNGKSIYPVWMDTMLELERTGNQYYEIVFTGATRTGKSSTAVSDAAYNLYRLMCLRDPQAYFGLKSVSTISIFFFNLNATLARGVAYKEFNSTLAASPYFMDHGRMSKSEANPTYIPDGGLIEIKAGSDSSQALGQATYCVTGDTLIVTKSGKREIRELERTTHQLVLSYNTKTHEAEFVNAKVLCTGFANRLVEITLENDIVIRCTPNHKVLLDNGAYKKARDLTLDDEVADVYV